MNESLFDGLDDLYRHAEFWEHQIMRAGCRCENVVFVCFYLQDASKLQTAGIKFTNRPEIRFFAPQGQPDAPIDAKLGRADGHMGPHVCATPTVGVGMRPKNIKNFHLLENSRPAGATPLTDFENFRSFIYPTILHQTFKYDVFRFTGYGVIAEKPRVGQLACRKN